MKNDRPDFYMSVQMQINESIISENKRNRLNNEGPDEKARDPSSPKIRRNSEKKKEPLSN